MIPTGPHPPTAPQEAKAPPLEPVVQTAASISAGDPEGLDLEAFPTEPCEVFLPNGFTADTLPTVAGRLSRLGSQPGTPFFVGTRAECEAKVAELTQNPDPAAWEAFREAGSALDWPGGHRKDALAIVLGVRQGLSLTQIQDLRNKRGPELKPMKTVELRLTFNISNEALLTELSDVAIKAHGGGIGFDNKNPLAFRVAELLLHSNPDISPYLDYGIEIQGQTLFDGVPGVQGVAIDLAGKSAALAVLAQDDDPILRERVARNLATSPEVLDLLARDASVDVRLSVARNPVTPAATLAVLAQDHAAKGAFIRQGVALHPATTPDVLIKTSGTNPVVQGGDTPCPC